MLCGAFSRGCAITPTWSRSFDRKKMPNLSPSIATGFFVGEMMDKLLACAKAFEDLLNTKYKIIIAHKSNQLELHISFNAIDFHHLMGLGKLKDLRIHRENRTDVFKKILKNMISYETIKNSRYIQEIENRFEPLSHLENLLDNNYLTFRYCQSQNPTSTIEADFLLSSKYQNNDIYIFLASKSDKSNYFCRSFFPKTNRDYTIGQTKYTLMYKEKRTISTGETVVQYKR